MKGADILRFVDTIHREKNIDKEVVFEGLENALFSAARKKLGNSSEIFIEIDRKTGHITAFDGTEHIDPTTLGRIAALTAKQVMIQKFREAERDVVYDEYYRKAGTLITGQIQRIERSNVVVNLGGRAEGIIPWRERVPNETYNLGDRIKCVVLEVKKVRQQVRIILSRATPKLLHFLFELEVPEVGDRIIEIRELARDAGHRSKVAVLSVDHNVDCVGACVGIRGSRIKNIVDELNGEKIDIVRWNESTELFIRNSMKPAEINEIVLDHETKQAKLFVNDDQLSLAIGRRGQNVRLASELTGWDLLLLTGTPSSPEQRFQVAGKERKPGQSQESRLDAILPAAPADDSAPKPSLPTGGSASSKLDAILSGPGPSAQPADASVSSPDDDASVGASDEASDEASKEASDEALETDASEAETPVAEADVAETENSDEKEISGEN